MKTLIQSTLLILALGIPTTSTNATTKSWIGPIQFPGQPIIEPLWSIPNHWDPAGAPQNGDDLYFHSSALPGQGAGGYTINNLTNLTVGSMRFSANADWNTAEWTVAGNTLTVTHLIEAGVSTDEDVYIDCGVRLGGNVRFEASHGAELYPYIGLHLHGPIDLNGYTLHLVEDDDGDLDIASPISGNGNLIIEEGSIELTGNVGNTFSGSVLLASQEGWQGGFFGSILILNKSSGLAVPGSLTIGINSTVKLDRPHQIVDTATVVVRSGGQLKLQGNTETVSGLFIDNHPVSEGTVHDTLVDSGGATFSVADNITVQNFGSNLVASPVIAGTLGLPPGNHVIHTSGNQPWALNIEAQIIGDGGFTKTGSSTLKLTGNNSFNGDAILQEGRVDCANANSFGSANGVTIMAGGELQLSDALIGNETLFVNQCSTNTGNVGANLVAAHSSIWAGPVILNTNLIVIGDSLAFTGPLSGPAGLHTFNASTSLDGNEPNTYTGPTIARGSLLNLSKMSGVPAFGGPLIVGDGDGSLNEVRWDENYQRLYADVTLSSDALVNLNGHADDFGPIAFNGGTIATGSGELGLYGLVTINPSATEAIMNGRVGLPSGAHEFRVGDGPPLADLTVNAAVVGSGYLRKTGLGQMWLNASNSYAGVTLVEEGSLVAFNASALGSTSLGTVVSEGASLILNAPGSTIWEQITAAGSGDGSHGTLNVFGSVTLRNPFPGFGSSLDISSNTIIRVESGSVFTVDGGVSGNGPLTKTGPGTLVLANTIPNTYSGDTLVTEGVLDLSKPGFAISVPGNLIVGPAPLNSTAIARWSTSGGMNPGAIVTINARSLLDLNGNGLSLSRLNLNDGGDAQTGAGQLSFPFVGMVAVGSLSQLGSHSGSTFSGNIGLPANGTLIFAVNGYAPTAPFDFNPELIVSASMAAPPESPMFERAGITKTGMGTMRLSGGNSFNGRSDVMEGTLIAGSSLALGSAFDGTFVLNNAKLALEGGLTIQNEILVLNSAAVPALESFSGESYWSGQVIMNQHSTVGTQTNSLLQLAGVISGAANFTKVGPGTLRFTGGNHNTYSGQTFINEGTLLLSKPFVITAVPGTLNIGTPAGVPATVANLASYQVVGNIVVNRGGLLNVQDQVENVDHLWLYDGGDVQTTTGTLFLKAIGSIQVFPGAVGDTSTIAGNLDMDGGPHFINVGASTSPMAGPALDIIATITSSLGSISMQKVGPGTLRLAGNNPYSGSTTINAGVLLVDGSQPSSSVVIGDDARLSGNGRVGMVTFAGPSGVVAPGTSPGIFQCGPFNSGGAGGILQIELNGTTAGTGYDRLFVHGLVTLDGMTLQAAVNFAPSIGSQFMILGNDFFDEIQGTFNGLPQGGTATFGDHIFQINYAGGDGNDVILTKIGDVYRPALTIERAGVNSVRLLWPTNDPAFSLQSTTNLGGANPGWSSVPGIPALSGPNHVVTNSTLGIQRLYRLFKP